MTDARTMEAVQQAIADFQAADLECGREVLALDKRRRPAAYGLSGKAPPDLQGVSLNREEFIIIAENGTKLLGKDHQFHDLDKIHPHEVAGYACRSTAQARAADCLLPCFVGRANIRLQIVGG